MARVLCHASLFLSLLLPAVFAADLCAQRGGGGLGPAAGRPGQASRTPRRSEAVYDRVGAWFVDLRIEAAAEPAEAAAGGRKPDLLSSLPFVKEAKEAGQRALLYLSDPKTDADKHQAYEQATFQDEVGIATRWFVCARIDLTASGAKELAARYGDQAPLFVAFDADGQPRGELSQKGYKASANKLIAYLDKAGGKSGKLTVARFVAQYGELAKELEELERERSELEVKLGKTDGADKEKRAAMQRELDALAAAEQKLVTREAELIQAAQLPPRKPAAVRLGGRGGAQRARGRNGGGNPAGGNPAGGDPAGGDPAGGDPAGGNPGGGGRGRGDGG